MPFQLRLITRHRKCLHLSSWCANFLDGEFIFCVGKLAYQRVDRELPVQRFIQELPFPHPPNPMLYNAF